MQYDNKPTPPISGKYLVNISSEKEDPPEFKMEYRAKLDERCAIKITIRDSRYGGSISRGGELTQPNGRWIFFDPDRIADKIIDPILTPKAEEAVAQIYALDKVFRDGKRDVFVDTNGNKWALVK